MKLPLLISHFSRLFSCSPVHFCQRSLFNILPISMLTEATLFNCFLYPYTICHHGHNSSLLSSWLSSSFPTLMQLSTVSDGFLSDGSHVCYSNLFVFWHLTLVLIHLMSIPLFPTVCTVFIWLSGSSKSIFQHFQPPYRHPFNYIAVLVASALPPWTAVAHIWV